MNPPAAWSNEIPKSAPNRKAPNETATHVMHSNIPRTLIVVSLALSRLAVKQCTHTNLCMLSSLKVALSN
ncbi:MAG: hypothetical protein CMJ64_12960 [Planctomycetaceae bacterium]|nr:hypothetical protein [Planctomycetaceae bacterium]